MAYETLAVQLHIDNVTLPDDSDFDWSEEHVKLLIAQAMGTTDLEMESPITAKDFAVKRLSEDEKKGWSKVAYLETSEGYFFVTEALADHITVVYNRWD